MRSKTALIAAVALVVALAGCKQKTTTSETTASPTTTVSTTTVAQTNLTPEQLGEIGAKIKAHPSDAKRILSDNGMDEVSFEKAIRSVASDPAASRRYRDAYKKARA